MLTLLRRWVWLLALAYKVADRLNECQMEVIGDPGTTVSLIQADGSA